MKTQVFHTFLLADIASIQSAVPADVETAQTVQMLTARVTIPYDKVFEVQKALADKISEITKDGSDTYSQQIIERLAAATAAVDAQIEGYAKQFERAKVGNLTVDDVMINQDGGATAADVADHALKATRHNGALQAN
jgi:hypothetical protein